MIVVSVVIKSYLNGKVLKHSYSEMRKMVSMPPQLTQVFPSVQILLPFLRFFMECNHLEGPRDLDSLFFLCLI